MSSPGTLKSLSKTLSTHIPTLRIPLPEDLDEVLESYLRKHEKYDDSNSERLHDVLLSAYNSHVAGHPERLAGFVAVYSRLLPVLRTPSRIMQWWDLLGNAIEVHFSSERGLMSECFSSLLNLLSLDDIQSGEEGSGRVMNPFVRRVMSMWLEHYQGTSLRSSADTIEKSLRDSLVFYGKRRPKDFLTILDTFFVKSEYRMRMATLLCEFIQTQPPHLYEVLDTPLFNNLLRCLRLDTSTTVVSLTLTTLTMLLPHTPSSLVPHLPTLFNIYARLLFWHRERTEPGEPQNEQAYPRPLADSAGWEVCPYSSEFDGRDIPSLRNYFTILYGLYPINFMDYIRKPYRYLRHANDPNADSVEVQPSEIRHKSEEFRRGHLLHPNFYHLTIESEKTDHGRWQSSEPAEVVAECTALCIMEYQPGPEKTEDAPRRSSLFLHDEASRSIPDLALLSGNAADPGYRPGELPNVDSAGTQSHGIAGGDSPTLPAHLHISPSQTQLQDLIRRSLKSEANDSAPSPSISQHELSVEGAGGGAQVMSRPRTASSLVSNADINSQVVSQLRREIILLQTELGFERHLKLQHMAHMGELRRRQVKEAASEAEMQNLILANRNLKSRFEEAKNAEMQVRRESEKGRALAKKWETDLAAKLKTLREEAKKTKARGEELERELERSRTECDELKAQVCAFEARELNWKQNIQSYEIDKSEIDRMRSEVGRLTVTERDFQAKEAQIKQAIEDATSAEIQVELLNAKLAAQEQELERAKEAYESQIAALKSRAAPHAYDAQGDKPLTSSSGAVEAALSASRAKQAELQKQYDLLTRKYTILQSSLLDMQCDPAPSTSQPGRSEIPRYLSGEDAAGQRSPMSSSPTQARARFQREVSGHEDFEATSSYNATPPLESRVRPLPGGTAEATGGVPVVPGPSTDPKFYGRGGVGNRVRKEGKEKKDGKDKKGQEGSDKKDKKMGALRGMRNFHIA
ncbi:uncharacterized protein DNG_01060 [Cephalotrichum gorgonifer]|uniref:Hamartin domain-containing protein n=1 Tax=Cephalotrichum gorgonifer TaxID=2041049 RepID=A0AAE8MR96_9PEZI|nr:uncharacterized protein DNG_01060 [Cephalotrichum gorgonifer]